MAADKIVSIPLGSSNIPCWGAEAAGTSSIKAIFSSPVSHHGSPSSLAHAMEASVATLAAIFHVEDPPPTAHSLHHLNMVPAPTCLQCHASLETIDHVFCTCSITQIVWNSFPTSIIKPTAYSSFSQWFWSPRSKSHRELAFW